MLFSVERAASGLRGVSRVLGRACGGESEEEKREREEEEVEIFFQSALEDRWSTLLLCPDFATAFSTGPPSPTRFVIALS